MSVCVQGVQNQGFINCQGVVQGINCQYVFKALIIEVLTVFLFVEVLLPSQPNGVMSSTVSLPNHTFTGQA